MVSGRGAGVLRWFIYAHAGFDVPGRGTLFRGPYHVDLTS